MPLNAAAAPAEPAAPPDNRAHRRHLTILRTARLASETGEGLGIVRNVSEGGMKIDARADLAVGEQVTISLFDGQQIEATVVWREGSEIGVRFETLIDVGKVLAVPEKLENGKPPRLPRLKADRDAIVDIGANKIVSVTIQDLSQRGARIAIDRPLTLGQDIWLWPPGVKPVCATVRWFRDGAAGLAFHETLGIEGVTAWLRGPGSNPKDGPAAAGC